jgi:hypothetical protein
MRDESATKHTEAKRHALRAGAGLAIVGIVVIIVASRFHGGTDPADLQTVLPEYAANPHWKAAHLGQFIGFLCIAASLIILLRHLQKTSDSVLALLGMTVVVIAAATFAVNHAVDGVAIRYVAENWVSAPPEDKVAVMGLAQAVRHIEQGLSALVAINLGIALALSGVAILSTRVFPRWLGVAAVPVGIIYLVAGVTLYYFGFSQHVLSFWSSVLLSIWLLASAYVLWREAARTK